MRFAELVETSRRVGETSARNEKIAILAGCLTHLGPAESAAAIAMLAGAPRQGRIGLGWSAMRQARAVALHRVECTPSGGVLHPGTPPADRAALEVLDVDACLTEIAAISGRGSTGARATRLQGLLSRATPAEQDFLERLVLGGLRQGAEEGVMIEAIARATDAPAGLVRRAAMLGGDLAQMGSIALSEGEPGLRRFGLEPGRAIQPMLAQTAEGVEDALARLGPSLLEHKLDGARVQVHRVGSDVRVFTRELNDVTARVPEIVEAALALPVREVVLDGEAIALRVDGKPQPFQVTMQRFGRRLEVDRVRAEQGLSVFLFDVLHLDGEDVLDRPVSVRKEALAQAVPEALRVPHVVPATAAEAAAFLRGALAHGHEGVMAKGLSSPYEAGRRGAGWLKIKPAHTLDLVVLAVERGSGRRTGWLSNIHLGARDPVGGGFVMLGKTFKGMTDEILAWQTRRFQELAVAQDEWVVHVRPEQVVEIAFDGVQTSSHYPAGLALRFARVKRYRHDKSAVEADTIETVRAIHAASRGHEG